MSDGRIAIIAAMPGELAPFVRAANLTRVSSGNVHVFESDHFVAAHAGIGRARALESCGAAVARGSVRTIVSAGWVGALNAHADARTVQRPRAVINASTGEQFPTSASEGPVLVTVSRVADHVQKRELQQRWHADLVDMEAAHVARFTRQQGITFDCIRAVSDAHDAKLPDFNLFNTPEGQLSISKLLLWIAVRPWWWRSLAQMGRNSSAAARTLADALLHLR
jgi:adenosylhomocysteine nucleosidase